MTSMREPKRLVSEHFRSDGRPKRRWPTQAAAEAHRERYGLTDKCVYPCTFCGGFHMATRRGADHG